MFRKISNQDINKNISKLKDPAQEETARNIFGPLYDYLTVMSDNSQFIPKAPPGRANCLIAAENWLPFDGFIFPVQWVEGLPHCSCLPVEFHHVADEVLSITGHEKTGLRRIEEFSDLDLSGMTFAGLDSTKTTLAASLHLLKLGGQINPHVFSTGNLQNDYIRSVENTAKKADLVVKLFRKGKPIKLFVPRENYDEAKNASSSQRNKIDIMSFESSGSSWDLLMGNYLRCFQIPPGKAEKLMDRIDYSNLNHVNADPEQWRTYFLKNLVEEIAEHYRRSIQPPFPTTDKLLTTLGFNYELLVLVERVFKPRKLLVVTSPEVKEDKSLQKQLKNNLNVKPEMIVLDPSNMDSNTRMELKTMMLNFFSGKPHENNAVEATAGTKIMTLLCAEVARKANVPLYIMQHTTKNRHPRVHLENCFIRME